MYNKDLSIKLTMNVAICRGWYYGSQTSQTGKLHFAICCNEDDDDDDDDKLHRSYTVDLLHTDTHTLFVCFYFCQHVRLTYVLNSDLTWLDFILCKITSGGQLLYMLLRPRNDSQKWPVVIMYVRSSWFLLTFMACSSTTSLYLSKHHEQVRANRIS